MVGVKGRSGRKKKHQEIGVGALDKPEWFSQTKYAERVEKYCDDVLSGARPTGQMEKHAVNRYLKDIEDPRWYIDEEYANWACSFMESIKITQGELAGNNLELYPLQTFIVWNLFGFYHEDSEKEKRRFTEALIQLGRGSGKTPLGAGLLLLAGGFHPSVPQRAESYLTATKKAQAKIAFDDLKCFVEDVPHLRDRCEIRQHHITVLHNRAKFEYIASDGNLSDGLRIQGLLKDELHKWTKAQKKLNSVLNTGLGKFESPLSITITTAGDETSTVWLSYDSIARQVVDQDTNTDLSHMFVMICEMDAKDDLFDINNYHKSSPLMAPGITKQSHIETMIEKARIDADEKHDLERYHANRKVHSRSKIFTPKLWAKGNKDIACDNITPHAGCDLGWKDDLASLCYVWSLGEGKYRAEWDVFIPKYGARDLNEEPWATWIREGLVIATESEMTDLDVIYESVQRRQKEHGIATLAYDSSNARDFASTCQNKFNIELYAFAQIAARFNEPITATQQLLREEKLFHGGNPVASWCASNASFKTVGECRMPHKINSDDKIDPFVAYLMALSEAMFHTTDESHYKNLNEDLDFSDVGTDEDLEDFMSNLSNEPIGF